MNQLLHLAFSVVAHAQTVTNLSVVPPASYLDLTSAVADASPGDELEIDGALAEGATLDIDVMLRGVASGSSITASTGPVLLLEPGVELGIDGIDLQAAPEFRAVASNGFGNLLTVRNARLRGGGAEVTGGGGLIRLDHAVSVELENVELLGTPGVDLADDGGAIYVLGSGRLSLRDVTFTDIVAGGDGGAVLSAGVAVDCERCTFDHTGSRGGAGGAIFIGGGAELRVRQSAFCSTAAFGLGGAIFGTSDAQIVSSVFTETDAGGGGAIFANGGDWLVRNNHFLGIGSDASSGAITSMASDFEVRNSLFVDSEAFALDLSGNGSVPVIQYNWFYDNQGNTDVSPLVDATNNVTETDPGLLRWTPDGNCGDDEPWPEPFVSPLIDAGDPALFDPDGSAADVGAFGGPDADATYWTDGDADGLPFFMDCDDDDAATLGEQPFYPDCDEDGEGSGTPTPSCFGPPVPACDAPNDPGQWSPLDTDCDDNDATVFALADETCDLMDQNCDGNPYAGAVDARVYFLDLDGDGIGGASFTDCGGPFSGWVARGGDCDDDDATIFPGALDPCGDGVDQDCGGLDGDAASVVEWFADADGDGFGDPRSTPIDACVPNVVEGYAPNNADCDDSDATVNPDALEVCDGVDQDCDGEVDDTGPVRRWYVDADGDGVGRDDSELLASCEPEGAWVPVAGDCQDADPLRTACGCGCASGAPSAPGLSLGFAALIGGLALRRRRTHRWLVPGLVATALLGSEPLAQGQTLENDDFDADETPIELPYDSPIDVPGWDLGSGLPIDQQIRVAAVGVPVYCDEILTESPNNTASWGTSRHFAYAEALTLPTVVLKPTLSTTVTDLDPALTYRVRFEMASLRQVGQNPGLWQVTLGLTTLPSSSPVLASPGPVQGPWQVETLDPFVVEGPSAELVFEAISLEADLSSVTPLPDNGCGVGSIEGQAQLLLDGIAVIPDTDGDGLYDDEDPCPITPGLPLDHDDDGLVDELDQPEAWGTDPCEADTDDDGLSDGEEVAMWEDLSGCPDPGIADSDGDGLTDGEELAPDRAPLTVTACEDATTEAGPVSLVSDPCTAHSDDDGLPDGEELSALLATSPSNPDTDGDGLWDDEDDEPTVCDDFEFDTGQTDDRSEQCCSLGKPCCPTRKEQAGCGCRSGATPLLGLAVLPLAVALRRRSRNQRRSP